MPSNGPFQNTKLRQDVASINFSGEPLQLWAGPLSVGAAVIPADRRVYKVRDSKLLTEDEREALFDRIAGWCERWSVGHASPEECDRLGMSDAQRLAAKRAIATRFCRSASIHAVAVPGSETSSAGRVSSGGLLCLPWG